jgi:protein gp37
MSTKIEWCQRPGTKPEVWNVVTGCTKVSQGCKNCYAEVMHKRLQGMSPSKYNHDFLSGAHEHEDLLTLPLKWKTPRTVFVNSMSDLFHVDVSFHFIDAVFRVMNDLEQHTYIILTKRPDRMKAFFEWKQDNSLFITWQPKSNIWLGVSIEDQKTADERIETFVKIQCPVRFLSCEPLLGPINLNHCSPWINQNTGTEIAWVDCLDSHPIGSPNKPFIDWVIVGGESGKNARPMHPNWVRSLKDQCEESNIPFFFKQWGEWMPDREFTSIQEISDDPTVHKQEISLIKKNGIHDNRILLDGVTEPLYRMVKVGKKKSGNTLDGRQYLEFPKTN